LFGGIQVDGVDTDPVTADDLQLGQQVVHDLCRDIGVLHQQAVGALHPRIKTGVLAAVNDLELDALGLGDALLDCPRIVIEIGDRYAHLWFPFIVENAMPIIPYPLANTEGADLRYVGLVRPLAAVVACPEAAIGSLSDVTRND